ncbi:chromate transporter [Microbacterium sp.]|uniref:chromate transporter n=1 Tax=Microbacterium sp. TaxID=51671 RepID=UPI003A8772EC
MSPSGRGPVGHVLSMLKVGVIGFGGGSALIPVMEKELVRRDGLSADEFLQDTVIANITPGALPVKLAALSGARLRGSVLAVVGALAVAVPGTLGTVALIALFGQLGPGAIRMIEFASLGITAFIIYLLGHYVMKVVAPGGHPRAVPIVIAVVAFVLCGAGETIDLGHALFDREATWHLPELSALGLVLIALIAISVFTLWQYLRRHTADEHAGDAGRDGQTRRALHGAGLFAAVTAVGLVVAVAVPPVGATLGFLALTLASTVTSFGGGEAYVGVADGFFVASGLVDQGVFYGQIVPVANALPGPILVKIAAAVAFVAGGTAGWLLAGAAFLVAVGSCSAIAVGVLAGYDRARNSLLIRNISTYILPVICGLLASTAVAMLHSNVRIAGEAGVPGWLTVLASIGLAVSVVFIHRLIRMPDILLIVLFGALSFAVLAAL